MKTEMQYQCSLVYSVVQIYLLSSSVTPLITAVAGPSPTTVAALTVQE